MKPHHPKGSLITRWPRTLELDYDPREWRMDPAGYVLIEADHKRKRILVGFCSPHGEPRWKVAGDAPIPLYYTIIKQGAITKPEHAAYLGEELAKAHLAILLGLEYVQDEQLDPEREHVVSEKDDALAQL